MKTSETYAYREHPRDGPFQLANKLRKSKTQVVQLSIQLAHILGRNSPSTVHCIHVFSSQSNLAWIQLAIQVAITPGKNAKRIFIPTSEAAHGYREKVCLLTSR